MRPNLDGYGPAVDPSVRAQAAHQLARTLISDPTVPRDATTTARFVAVAQEFGLATLAELFSSAPAVSLPGSLWRLYALHQWITGQPEQAARWYALGRRVSVAEVVAGVADPHGPSEVAATAHAILTGAFTGDYADACERAAAFVLVAARGRAADPDPGESNRQTGTDLGTGLNNFVKLGEDLARAANAYRAGELD